MVDTIFAVSSGAVPSGVAVVRVSGPDAVGCFAAFGTVPPETRRASLRTLRIDSEPIDRCLALFFAAPASFTGEDCVELQLHGSPAVVAAVLRRLGTISRFRPAEPGEFTRRAFGNGRIDLTEAEALAQLIEAETEAQRRLAAAGSTGRQLALVTGWQSTLTRIRARLEAEMDFSDEGDVPADVSAAAAAELEELTSEMERHCAAFAGAEIVRRGFRVALAGRPNAGKSSLLNLLAGRDVAIVTEIAGTTRDRLEVSLDLDGYKTVLMDLAGLRETNDAVEKLGVDLAQSTLREADLVIWMDEDGAEPDWEDPPRRVLKLLSKADRAVVYPRAGWLTASSKTGEGSDRLLAAIVGALRGLAPADDLVAPATARQRHHLTSAIDACRAALEGWLTMPTEIVSEELRGASFSLGRIVGQVDAEALLDDVFGRFCIGK